MLSIVSRYSLAATAGAAAAATAASLGAYNVDPESVSVSGISSGGFFTVQLGVAYSDIFKAGFGVFAGGPYDCARDQYYTYCMNDLVPSIILPTDHMEEWSGNEIDRVSNLANRKIYMQVGSADTTVGPNVMDQLDAQLSFFYTSSNVQFNLLNGAVHTFPTDFNGAGDNPCDLSTSPFISNCGYDGAGAVLQWIYGDLNPRNTGTLSGSIVAFSQTGAYGAAGMDTTGYLYVPAACEDGSTVCKLHVAMHGCGQSYSDIGMTFIDNTGYTMWADTNDIIVLFPQAIPNNSLMVIWGGTLLPNPYGCWDFVGWYGDNADQIGGVQLTAVVNQVNQIISG